AARGAAARPRRAAGRLRALPPAALLQRRAPLPAPDRRQLDERPPRRLRLHPAGAAPAPALRARLQQLLGLLRVRHRQDELGAALVLRDADRRGRARRRGAVRGFPLVAVRAAARGPGTGRGARGGGRPAGGTAAAAGVGDDGRARRDTGLERVLPDDPVPLLLRLRDARAGAPRRVLPAMKIVVLTTSYPRYEGDPAGNFVADAVRQLRARGIEVEVVSPASFRHFGIAYGAGVLGNLKRAPWKLALVPAMMASFARAARRAARDADLVHAHWLPSGAVALATGKPFVVQLWGTDVELARRARVFARRVLSRARLTICASHALADPARGLACGARRARAAAARELGAGEVRVIRSAVERRERVAEPAEPPAVLFV